MAELKTVKIQRGQTQVEYVTVNERVKEFHRRYPEGYIESDLISEPSSNRIIVRARVYPNDIRPPVRRFTGWAQEMIGDGFINKASALENAETSAIGRALGFLNIGIDASIASADEVKKAKDMSKAPELNRPTPEQKTLIAKLLIDLGIQYTADNNQEFTQMCLDVIGVPYPNNREQADTVQAHLEEMVLDREAKRASDSD